MSLSESHSVEILGSGPRTLVLVHGYGCDKNMWRHLTPFFEQDYTLVLYDLMGCGGSDLSQYDKSKYDKLQGHADDLINVLSDLKIEKATLIGHSVSAMTVAIVANTHPKLVEEVIMICPSPSFINDGDYVGGFERSDILSLLETLDANYLGWSADMAPAIMGAPTMPEHGEALKNSFCQADPEIARHFAKVTFLSDHRDDVKGFKHRTLVIQCRDDVIVPPSVGEWMEKNMQKSQHVVLNATGHCPHISFPEETANAILSFLKAA